MKKNVKKTLKEVIKVRINNHISFNVASISDFKLWKAVFPTASIEDYNIQNI
jgi:hypothetical protein